MEVQRSLNASALLNMRSAVWQPSVLAVLLFGVGCHGGFGERITEPVAPVMSVQNCVRGVPMPLDQIPAWAEVVENSVIIQIRYSDGRAVVLPEEVYVRPPAWLGVTAESYGLRLRLIVPSIVPRVAMDGIPHDLAQAVSANWPSTARPFYLGVTEVTWAQFRPYLPPKQQDFRVVVDGRCVSEPDHPAVELSWDDAMGFCRWLFPSIRLPWVHEWDMAFEWSADANDSSRAPYNNVRRTAVQANLADESYKNWTGIGDVFPWNDGFAASAPIRTFAPNSLGFFDMDGNVSEYCMDPARSRDGHLVRGPSWCHMPADAGPQSLRNYPGSYHNEWTGFRIVGEIK